MTSSTPKTLLYVEQLFLEPNHEDAVPFTSAVFHALAAGETQAVADREDVSLWYVVKRSLDSGPTHHFQVYGVVAAECASELERLKPHVDAGTLSERDTTILSSIFRLSGTTPFLGLNALGELNAKTAHAVLHGPSRSNEELHVAAFMSLANWDGNFRFDQDWRRFAKGVEHKVAPALLSILMEKDINEFARAVLQMTRHESKEFFPEGTRDKVFEHFLRPFTSQIPDHLGREKFNIICDRLLPTANEEEQLILKRINRAYNNIREWNPEALPPVTIG